MFGVVLRRSARLAAKRKVQPLDSPQQPPRKKRCDEETEEQRRQRQHRVRKRRWEEVNNQRLRAIKMYEQKLEAEQKQQRCLGPVVQLEDEPPPKLYKGPGERAQDRFGRFVEAIRRQLEREQEISARNNTRTDDGESVSDEDGEAAEISQPAQEEGDIEVQSESPPIAGHLEVLATGGHTANTWPYIIVRAETDPDESGSDISEPAQEEDHNEVQSESPPITEHLEISARNNTRTDDDESVSDEDGEAAEISQPAQEEGDIEVQSESPPIAGHLEISACNNTRTDDDESVSDEDGEAAEISQPAQEEGDIEVQSESPPIAGHLEETVTDLKNWRPVIRDGRLCIEGERGDRRRRLPYVTPPVTRVRKGDKRLVTVIGGVKFRLIGDVSSNVNDVPDHIWGKFRGGIPRYWQGAAEQLEAAQCSLPRCRGPYSLRPRK